MASVISRKQRYTYIYIYIHTHIYTYIHKVPVLRRLRASGDDLRHEPAAERHRVLRLGSPLRRKTVLTPVTDLQLPLVPMSLSLSYAIYLCRGCGSLGSSVIRGGAVRCGVMLRCDVSAL